MSLSPPLPFPPQSDPNFQLYLELEVGKERLLEEGMEALIKATQRQNEIIAANKQHINQC